jgi:hypothetical protein
MCGSGTSILGQDVQMKNLLYLISSGHLRERRRRRAARNRYTGKNPDALSILSPKKTKPLHLIWTKNASKPETNLPQKYKLYYNLIALEL